MNASWVRALTLGTIPLFGALGAVARAEAPLRVGSYYFPGWFCADRWVPVVEYGDRTPLLGTYRDASPEVQDWHIRQATQHGLSFWIFDWYYDHRTGTVGGHNAALDEGFLHASRRGEMDFAIMWCNEEAGEPGYTQANLTRLVEVAGARYFGQPNYLRTADGRCILVLTRPDRLIACFGVEGTRAMLGAMREAARPWGGLFLAAIKTPTDADLRALADAGFDACTLYGYSEHGMAPGSREAPWESVPSIAEALWRGGAESAALPLIPCVSPGWDSRPWYGERGLYRSGSSPELLERMCRSVRPYVDRDLGLAVVGTWNEFGEGSYLEPTEQRGCTMLDAVQRGFFGACEPHGTLRPSVEELRALDYSDVPAHLEERIARQGGNLIANPGFESEWGWTYFDGQGVSFATGGAHAGSRALLLPRSKGGAKTVVLSPGVAWPFRARNRVVLEAGRGYRVSAWVRGRAQVNAALFDREERWLGRYQPVAEGGQAGSWTKLEAVVAIADPEAITCDFEVVPLDDEVLVDDVGVWAE